MPNETTPEEVGAVAVGNGDNTPTELVEHGGKALAMADAGDELRSSAAEKRRQASDDILEANFFDEGPEDVIPRSAVELQDQAKSEDRVADRVEEDTAREYELEHPESIDQSQLDKLASEVAKVYKGEQEHLYESELRQAAGLIEAIRKGLIKPMGYLAADLSPSTGSRWGLDSGGKKKLREAVYQIAGIEPPASGDFEDGGYVSEDNNIMPGKRLILKTARVRGQGGVTITEQRYYRSYGGVKKFAGGNILAGSSDEIDRFENPDLFDLRLP